MTPTYDGLVAEVGVDPLARLRTGALLRRLRGSRTDDRTGHAGKAADIPEMAYRLKLAGSSFVDIADLLRVTSLTAASLVQEGANAMPRRRAHMTPAMRAEEDQRWSHAKLR